MSEPLDTRDLVLRQIRRSPRTVRDLADELGVTTNAVRDHISVLEGEGLVAATRLRRGTGGKPARVYELTQEGEDSFARAYDVVLQLLLEVLKDELGPEELRSLLRRVGRRAARAQPRPGGDLRQRLEGALEIVGEMGGMADILPQNGGYRVQGYGCPVAALVRQHDEVCALTEALLSELTGAAVREECNRGDRPSCSLVVEPNGGPPSSG